MRDLPANQKCNGTVAGRTLLSWTIPILWLATACAPTQATQPRQPGILEELDQEITRATFQDQFSGAVLLAKNGKPFFRKAYGLANRSFDVPTRIDTKLNLGSMNKMFTTVAIAQLQEQGKLDYNDVIGKFLGMDWISEEIGRKVKIRHLLTHTAGTGTFFNDLYWKSARDLFREVDDYKPLLAGMTLAFEPGTKWQYSNSGFVLLGAIVERLSGERYSDYVHDHIYRVAGMTNTGEFDMEELVPNLAVGYGTNRNREGKEIWVNNLFAHVIRGGPAGGGFSTVDDLLQFDLALRNDLLIRPETRELLWTSNPIATDGKAFWGYGFITRNQEGLGRVVFHSGGFLGISSILDIYRDSGFTVVILSNLSTGLDAVRGKIPRVLTSYVDQAPNPGEGKEN